jgi:hypothetical protein
LCVVARQQGRGLAAVATEAGAEVVSASSLKAALDLDWDDPQARQQALSQVLTALDAVERWLAMPGRQRAACGSQSGGGLAGAGPGCGSASRWLPPAAAGGSPRAPHHN